MKQTKEENYKNYIKKKCYEKNIIFINWLFPRSTYIDAKD